MAKVEPFEVVPWDVVRARITRLVFRFLRDRDRKMRAVSPGSPSFATVYRVCARSGQETIPSSLSLYPNESAFLASVVHSHRSVQKKEN